ncbi:Glycoside hydrolase, family 5 [Corchorus olitorius]|uniref:Glycoside hydrolase, family 5 n=1 Tax=Corchorus olitorius TaxID=93759 RepID=A0A1R3JHD3_9ROSI|nr:Glycoside hydrolase, family 5 [Corchorus olitorius]
MAIFSQKKQLLVWIFSSCLLCLTSGKVSHEYDFGIKAVNLGGWLVTEGWIKPSLFDGIVNNDFLDGNPLQFKSVTNGKYLSAKSGGGTPLAADQTIVSDRELFRLWRINDTTFNFRVFNDRFVGIENAGKQTQVVAVSKTPAKFETFEIVRKPGDSSLVRIKAANGFFIQVNEENVVTADYAGYTSRWKKDDPSVFIVTINGTAHGEYQVTNGYGPEKAPKVMREHWNTFIVEDDFKFIADNGLNAVRIPVGWWIASDPTPPLPYVGGSLKALDNAFLWSQKYGLKVIIDLHAAPGSQNGYEHSSSRDGSLEWGKTDETLQKSVAVIDFLTARYVKNPSFYAIELINEPRAPMVSLETLIKYYKAGYKAVRKHSSKVYVMLSNRLGATDPTELVPLARGLKGSVIDYHSYVLFSADFKNMTVPQILDFIRTNRSAELNLINKANGPLTFVGEWTAEWEYKGGTKKDYMRFVKTQLKVYKQATMGWAYWTLKNVNNHWSLEWMIKNGYIKL